MKKVFFALMALAILLSVSQAHAYAIYNHTGYEVCAKTRIDLLPGECKFKISPNSHHNGAHGSGIKHLTLSWTKNGYRACFGTDRFDIPDGGYVRVYDNEVKIYKHSDEQVGVRPVRPVRCSVGKSKKTSD